MIFQDLPLNAPAIRFLRKWASEQVPVCSDLNPAGVPVTHSRQPVIYETDLEGVYKVPLKNGREAFLLQQAPGAYYVAFDPKGSDPFRKSLWAQI